MGHNISETLWSFLCKLEVNPNSFPVYIAGSPLGTHVFDLPLICMDTYNPVSYTHLDVYKRQVYIRYQVSRLLDHSFSIIISDLRNLNQVLDKNTRLIISTLDIQAEYTHDIRVIKVSTILTPAQKRELIDWLLHEEVYLKNNSMVSDLLNIIKEHAVIQEQEKDVYKRQLQTSFTISPS